jgi:hypothetical protein
MFHPVDEELLSHRRSRKAPDSLLIIRRMNMLSKITKALVATAMLATAIAASPALAQTQDRTQGQASGTYHGYPTSEWTRPDSW